MQIQGFSGQLDYVDCCPNEPEPGKAFCDEHTREAQEGGIPQGLKEYTAFCATKGMSLHICWICSTIYL